jgi:hypothetical protein
MREIEFGNESIFLEVCEEGQTPYTKKTNLIYGESVVYIAFYKTNPFFKTQFKSNKSLISEISDCKTVEDVVKSILSPVEQDMLKHVRAGVSK